jgi:hypothetical protein
MPPFPCSLSSSPNQTPPSRCNTSPGSAAMRCAGGSRNGARPSGTQLPACRK